MSICLNNDLHSIYLDGELPNEFKSKYESHLASCVACQKKLQSLKREREFFQKDVNEIPPLSLDKSFERLQSRLRYAHVAKTIYVFPKVNMKYVAGLAAAFLFALFIPFRFTHAPETVSNFSPIARNSRSPLEKTNVVLNGTIDENVIFENAETVSHSSFYRANSNTVQDFFYDYKKPVNVELPDVDVFRPEFPQTYSFSYFDANDENHFCHKNLNVRSQFSE